MEFPALSEGMPDMMINETLILSKNNITLMVDSASYTDCTLFLTNMRMVIVSTNYSLDIPLATLQNESFNQPILSANNLSGKNPRIDNSDFELSWKIYFQDGVGIFLPSFYIALHNMKKSLKHWTSYDVKLSAFVDPNDTSILYISQ